MEHFILSCLESRLEEDGSLYGRFLLGPFRIGQGITIATALRRTLLSELQGIAITAVEIEGAAHQYSSIVGVRESTLDITLNLKQVVLAGAAVNELPAIGYINVLGPKEVSASDLRLPNGISCVNKNHHIATLSSNGVLIMKFVISTGKNFLSDHLAAAQALKASVFTPKLRNNVGSSPLLSYAARGSRAELSGRQKGAEPGINCRSRYKRRLVSRVVLSSGAANDIIFYGKERRFTRVLSNSEIDTIFGDNQTSSEIIPSKSSFASHLLREADRGETDTLSKSLLSTSTESVNGSSTGEPSFSRTTIAQTTPPPLTVDQLAKDRTAFLTALAKRSNLPLGQERGERQSERIGASESGKDSISVGYSRALLPIDAVFMPVNKVNFSLQTDDQWQERRERVVLELWTNGSLSPRQALHEAATCLVYVFSLFRQPQRLQSALLPFKLFKPHQGTGVDRMDHNLNRSGATKSFSEARRENQGTEISRNLTNIPSWPVSGSKGNPQARRFSNEGQRGRRNNLERQRGTVAKEPAQSFYGHKSRGTDLGNLHLSVEAYVALKQLRIHTIDDLLICPPDFRDKGTNGNKLISFEISEKIKELNS